MPCSNDSDGAASVKPTSPRGLTIAKPAKGKPDNDEKVVFQMPAGSNRVVDVFSRWTTIGKFLLKPLYAVLFSQYETIHSPWTCKFLETTSHDLAQPKNHDSKLRVTSYPPTFHTLSRLCCCHNVLPRVLHCLTGSGAVEQEKSSKRMHLYYVDCFVEAY